MNQRNIISYHCPICREIVDVPRGEIVSHTCPRAIELYGVMFSVRLEIKELEVETK